MPSSKVTLPKSKRLSEPARRLLEKALTAMVRYPETVNMGDFYSHDATVEPTNNVPKRYCGTVACLAGHIVIAAGVKVRRPGSYNFDGEAGLLLGLGRDEDSGFYSRLFETYDTSTGDSYPISPLAQARAVVARVKHWIRTGK